MSVKSVVRKVLTGVFAVLGIATLIPSEHASKVCMLGYKAICAFSPISTIICFIIAAATYFALGRK
ncbi:MAG: hypothetical protein ACXQS5_04730 [Candidatus Methanospirareceae archaeon]